MTQMTPPRKCLRPRNLSLIVLLGTALTWASVLTVQAVAAGTLNPQTALATSLQGALHGLHPRPFSDLTEAEVEDRIERLVKHVAIEIDATDEQSAKITEL
ncbi:MAG: hypothetical protein AAGC79_06020, partial [Pseudomonadota bacterium]